MNDHKQTKSNPVPATNKTKEMPQASIQAAWGVLFMEVWLARDIMELMYVTGVLINLELRKEKSMAIQHSEQKDRISLEEFFALLESDPEHRYEYIDGYAYILNCIKISQQFKKFFSWIRRS